MGEVDHTLLLAQFLSNLTYEDLTPHVISQATKSLFNSLGCGLGYARHGQAEKAFSMIADGRPCEDATILGRQQRASVENAILINGIALTTADYDDTHLKTVIHPSGTPLAALLSWASRALRSCAVSCGTFRRRSSCLITRLPAVVEPSLASSAPKSFTNVSA